MCLKMTSYRSSELAANMLRGEACGRPGRGGGPRRAMDIRMGKWHAWKMIGKWPNDRNMLGKLSICICWENWPKIMLDMNFVYIIEWPVKLCISRVLENLYRNVMSNFQRWRKLLLNLGTLSYEPYSVCQCWADAELPLFELKCDWFVHDASGLPSSTEGRSSDWPFAARGRNHIWTSTVRRVAICGTFEGWWTCHWQVATTFQATSKVPWYMIHTWAVTQLC